MDMYYKKLTDTINLPRYMKLYMIFILSLLYPLLILWGNQAYTASQIIQTHPQPMPSVLE